MTRATYSALIPIPDGPLQSLTRVEGFNAAARNTTIDLSRASANAFLERASKQQH
jgi:hypothetical protein